MPVLIVRASIVSKKSPKIAALLAALPPSRLDPHYAGYFECFNRQLFYEAHDVLEELWLTLKGQPDYLFYKGLIQVAGGFVHLQKNKLDPAARLFRHALKHTRPFLPRHDGLDVAQLHQLIESYLSRIETSHYTANPYNPQQPPEFRLEEV